MVRRRTFHPLLHSQLLSLTCSIAEELINIHEGQSKTHTSVGRCRWASPAYRGHTDTSTRPAVREVVCGLRGVHLHGHILNGWSYLSLKLKSGRLCDSPAFARRPPILYPHSHVSFTRSENAVLVFFVLLCQNP